MLTVVVGESDGGCDFATAMLQPHFGRVNNRLAR